MINFKKTVLVALMLGSTNAFALSASLTGSYPLTENDSPVNGYELATKVAINTLGDSIKENAGIFTSNITENEKQLLISATPFVIHKEVTNKRIKSCPESTYGCALVDVTAVYDLSEIKKYVEQVTLNAALKEQVQRLADHEIKNMKGDLSETKKATAYMKLAALIDAGGDDQTQTFMINDNYNETKQLVSHKPLWQIREEYDDYTRAKLLYSGMQEPLTNEQKKEFKKLNMLAMEAAKSGYKIRSIGINRMTDTAIVLKITSKGNGLNDTSYNLMDKSMGVYASALDSLIYKPADNCVLTNLPSELSPTEYYANGYEAGTLIGGINLKFTNEDDPRITPLRGIVLVQELYYGAQKKPFVTYALAGDIKGYNEKMHPQSVHSPDNHNWDILYYNLYYPNGSYSIRAEKPKGFNPKKNIPIKAKQRVITF
ncbi:hypothetical protein [Photobacterium iliopiscarium]|uniref:hypothetical protein n=1 Tax=Photobacterium iliopiscarium TaxID=56192 RepID=UPI001E648409|nr:hypothetical protein [Photobacterium iliopiscarium]MCD9485926.1 hypothetical protein [Photobacterium iliopiscarium]MCF2242623.1 hypothetical protein [Photobacterium iliopiscarium]